jgi:MFS family permease
MKLSVILVLAALIAAANPCTISVLIMSISSLLGKSKKQSVVAAHTAMFGLGVFATTLAFGFAASFLFGIAPTELLPLIGVIISAVLVVLGLMEVKDYFWYGRGPSLKYSTKTEKNIHTWTKKHHTIWRGFGLGVYSTLKLSHYTLALVVATMFLAILNQPKSLMPSLIWAATYSAPILLACLGIVSGISTHGALTWKEDTKHRMRLSIGLLYVFVGLVILVGLVGGLRIG